MRKRRDTEEAKKIGCRCSEGEQEKREGWGMEKSRRRTEKYERRERKV